MTDPKEATGKAMGLVLASGNIIKVSPATIVEMLLANPEARMAVLLASPEYEAARQAIYRLCRPTPEDLPNSLAELVAMAEVECNAEHERATAAESLATEIRDDFGIATSGLLSAIATYKRRRSAENLRHVFGTADAARDMLAAPRAWHDRDQALSAATAESGKDKCRHEWRSPLSHTCIRCGFVDEGAEHMGAVEFPGGKPREPAPVAEAPERVTHEEARATVEEFRPSSWWIGSGRGFSDKRGRGDELLAYIAQQEAAEREAVELRKELEIRIADFRDSVNVMVPFPPEPGSDMAKVMIANATMRRERDAERAENAELKEADVDSCNKIVRLQEELANSQALSEALGEEWRRAGVLAERDELKAKLSEAERKLNLLLEEQRPSRLYAVIAERDEARAKLTAMALENVTVAAKLQTQAEEREALLGLANEWLQKAAQMRAEDGNVGALETLEDCANEVLNLLPASQEPTGVEPAKPSERCPGCFSVDRSERLVIVNAHHGPTVCADRWHRASDSGEPAKPPATIKLRELTQSRMPAGGVPLLDEQPEAKPPAPASQDDDPGRVYRCKHVKPGDGGIVDGCGWQGARVEKCPGCGSNRFHCLPADLTPTSTEGPSPFVTRAELVAALRSVGKKREPDVYTGAEAIAIVARELEREGGGKS